MDNNEQKRREKYAEALWPGEWLPEDLTHTEIDRIIAIADTEIKAAARKAWNEGFDRGWYAALERTGETIPNPYGQADVL